MTSPGTAVAVHTPPAPVMTFPQKLAYANELAQSGLLPEAFRRQPASVLWALEFGEALGLRGVVAMSAIHVIKGRPAPSAAMAAGLIRAKGHRLRVYVTEPTNEHPWGTAVAELTRKDDPEFTFRAEWSVEDALAADIIKIQNGRIIPNGAMGANWPKYPRQMMKARALGEVCRDAATDVLLGLHYLAEELDDAELNANGEVVSTGPAPVIAVTTAEEGAHPVTAHLPPRIGDVDTSGDPETDSGAGLEPITKATTAAMMAEFRRAKVGGKSEEERTKRLRVCEIITGQTLTTSADLTDADGRVVVETLRVAGDDVAAYVENLLREDETERAADLRGEDPAEDSPEEDTTH
jgi:hypothetical protein